LPESGFTIGPCFCSTGGNIGIADVIGKRLGRRRDVGGVRRGEQDAVSSLHRPSSVSRFPIVVTAAHAAAPLDFISDLDIVVVACYNIDK